MGSAKQTRASCVRASDGFTKCSLIHNPSVTTSSSSVGTTPSSTGGRSTASAPASRPACWAWPRPSCKLKSGATPRPPSASSNRPPGPAASAMSARRPASCASACGRGGDSQAVVWRSNGVIGSLPPHPGWVAVFLHQQRAPAPHSSGYRKQEK